MFLDPDDDDNNNRNKGGNLWSMFSIKPSVGSHYWEEQEGRDGTLECSPKSNRDHPISSKI